MVRKLAFGFGVVFMIVIGLGWMPQCITAMHMTPSGPERTMFDLFVLSMLDDITHGVTALVLVAAALHSRRAAVLAFTAFGWYYACDAVFFLLNGFFNDKPWSADIMLNLPHVVLSSIMLAIAYRLAPREELAERRVPSPAMA